MFGIIIWLMLAIAVGVYADNKGRSGVGFFLLSVLLSPLIGIVIAVLAAPNQECIENKALRNGGMKRCTKCAELVKREAKVCKHCQSLLPYEDVSSFNGIIESDYDLKATLPAFLALLFIVLASVLIALIIR
ncbi:hypothetical protein ACM65P_004326 [Vibrio alginolyticus]